MEKVIELRDTAEARALFGSADQNLKSLKRDLKVTLVARNGILRIRGPKPAVMKAANLVESLRREIREGREITPETVGSDTRARTRASSPILAASTRAVSPVERSLSSGFGAVALTEEWKAGR